MNNFGLLFPSVAVMIVAELFVTKNLQHSLIQPIFIVLLLHLLATP